MGGGGSEIGGGNPFANQAAWPTGGQSDASGYIPGTLSAGVRAMQGGAPYANDILRFGAGLGAPEGGTPGALSAGVQAGQAGNPGLMQAILRYAAGLGPIGGALGGVPGQFNQSNYSSGSVPGGSGTAFGVPLRTPAIGGGMNPNMAWHGPAGMAGGAMPMQPPTYTSPPPTANYQGGQSAYQQFVGRPIR